MAQSIYDWLQSIGYGHPLHPMLAHLPLGLVVGAFLFGLAAWLFRKPALAQSARHCTGLALLAAVPTIAAGYLDWQQFYGGAFLLPVKFKLGLAAVLALLLLAAALRRPATEGPLRVPLALYFLCALTAGGLGYFGGEMVYGSRPAVSSPDPPAEGRGGVAAEHGARLFKTNCAACHYIDSSDTLVGPGMQGLGQWEKMPVSGWPAGDDTLRRQIRTPYAGMPPFDRLSDAELDALLAYLKTL